ncbi:ATP-binding protein [Lentibacter algarum]|uniref:AAA family ATPase n=1 Tax=Lentibacter algarum TaxID=576131 RepID=UPI001C068DBA|nr:ATP-binding protein [Lentibacter algarum]MBU2980777.1 ATP-binding protein [Lentibacter algarum]
MPELHVLCGRIASGKSTLSAELTAHGDMVCLAEDMWLSGLFGDQMNAIADYVQCSAKVRAIAGPLCVDILRAGASVVMDFAANRRVDRAWMLSLAEAAGAEAQLHYLDVASEICLERLQRRNALGEHPFAVSEDQFWQINKHFEAPTEDEGFSLAFYH